MGDVKTIGTGDGVRGREGDAETGGRGDGERGTVEVVVLLLVAAAGMPVAIVRLGVGDVQATSKKAAQRMGAAETNECNCLQLSRILMPRAVRFPTNVEEWIGHPGLEFETYLFV